MLSQVTFSTKEDAEAAVRDANPMIDGRKANCNLAAFGRKSPNPDMHRGRKGKGGRGRAAPDKQGSRGARQHDSYAVYGGGPQPAWIGYAPQGGQGPQGYAYPQQVAYGYPQAYAAVGYYPQMAIPQMGYQLPAGTVLQQGEHYQPTGQYQQQQYAAMQRGMAIQMLMQSNGAVAQYAPGDSSSEYGSPTELGAPANYDSYAVDPTAGLRISYPPEDGLVEPESEAPASTVPAAVAENAGAQD